MVSQLFRHRTGGSSQEPARTVTCACRGRMPAVSAHAIYHHTLLFTFLAAARARLTATTLRCVRTPPRRVRVFRCCARSTVTPCLTIRLPLRRYDRALSRLRRCRTAFVVPPPRGSPAPRASTRFAYTAVPARRRAAPQPAASTRTCAASMPPTRTWRLSCLSSAITYTPPQPPCRLPSSCSFSLPSFPLACISSYITPWRGASVGGFRTSVDHGWIGWIVLESVLTHCQLIALIMGQFSGHGLPGSSAAQSVGLSRLPLSGGLLQVPYAVKRP